MSEVVSVQYFLSKWHERFPRAISSDALPAVPMGYMIDYLPSLAAFACISANAS
jgi:hypothetical protein